MAILARTVIAILLTFITKMIRRLKPRLASFGTCPVHLVTCIAMPTVPTRWHAVQAVRTVGASWRLEKHMPPSNCLFVTPQQSHAGVFSKVDVERMSDTGLRSVNTCLLVVNNYFSWSITSAGPYIQINISITHASAWNNQNCRGEYAAMEMCFSRERNFIE